MTTFRIPISSPQNIFFDSQNIDDSDLILEQNYNRIIQSGFANNHFGSGVLPDALTDHILFDSILSSGLLDGKAINIQDQPTDSNNGNQLEVELTDSLASGKKTIKLLIIGLDFQNNLQYDRFVFNKNEKQLSSKHYRTILTILFNDFIGTSTQSFNLGGRIVIKETEPLTLSRDCIMISQDIEPNLFFRDFFVSSGGTIANVLSVALPSYNIDALNIKTGYTQLRNLAENDVSSQIGQKFLAGTNNIQKITLLLSVSNSFAPTNLVWTGDLLISIYQLQSTLACPTDIAPQLAIDFDPSSSPLAQLSVNYSDLLAEGVKLNTVPQPVDFVFSNTPVGSGLMIKPGSHYVVTAKRTGSADTCKVEFAVGTNSSSIMRETLFNGSVWVDVPEESLWFQVWTDAAKISDGQAYDAGHGVQVPKIKENNLATTVDYVLNQIQFVRNDLYYGLLQAATEQSVPVQDERTGNNVNSRQQFSPLLTLLNSNALANIQSVSGPLIVGTISDQNVKTYSVANSLLSAEFHEYGMVENQIVLKVITDSSDGYRYDQNVIELISELVNGNLNGAKIVPNIANPSMFYRISKAELITMVYGDVDGNGIIDGDDLLLAQRLIDTDLNIIPTHDQYIVNTTAFMTDVSVTWNIMNGMTVIATGTDGTITADPNNGSLCNFHSASAHFNSITNIGNYTIVISNSTASSGNNGTFKIVSLVGDNDLTVQKTLYTSDTILQVMRGDVNGDMILNSTDINLISNYIEVVAPFPATTSPANNVGTQLTAIRLTVEEYIDRQDDYPSVGSNRTLTVHTTPDIFLDGYTLFAGQNLKTNPLQFSITKQLFWNDSNVVVNSNPRLVPASFNYQSGFVDPKCRIQGTTFESFPQTPDFDPGRNDFFIPNNLIINDGGQIIRPDGYLMKMDFEIATVVIEVPPVPFDNATADGYTINLLTDFIADYTSTGFTRVGYPAMRFADCSKAGIDALINNQLRFGVSIQSFSPQLNGLDPSCLSGIIVDPKIGVYIDYTTGLLTLNFSNLFQDPVKQTLNTKVQITVYLKKAGWNNKSIFVDSTKAQNILKVPTPIPSIIVCPDPSIVIMS